MDFEFKIRQEHSKELSEEIADHLIMKPDRISEFLELLESQEELVHQRAAWVLASLSDKAPKLLIPHYEHLLNIALLDRHDAVKRNILRIFQWVQVPESLQGKLLEISFSCLLDPSQPTAIRVYSMQCIYTNAVKYPEILEELRISIEEFLPNASKGFQSRGRKILSAIHSKLDR